MGIIFVLIVLTSVILAVRRPTWLAYITVAELVVGGKGYLFWLELGGEKISIRMALFLVLIVAALWQTFRSRQFDFPRRLGWPVGLIVIWVVIMGLAGVARGYGASAVYTDMNGYLYLAIIWPWWLFLRRADDWRNYAVAVVLAGATLVGLKSWLMQLLFAQDVPQLTELYRWIRQTGIGEITLISKNVYRIFFQSQIYALLGLVLVMVGYIRSRTQPWWGIALLGTSLGVYLSLSRSFWLGAAVALIGYGLVVIWKRNWRALRRFSMIVPLTAFVWLMTTLALNFPYIIPPPGHPSNADAVVARLKSAGSAQASTARTNQFPPLMQAIGRNPITGQGFGATLTYYSTDPRIRGSRTTSAFELGYLDMVFHFGLIGLGLFGWWGWRVVQRLRLNPEQSLWLVPTVALATVTLTSPYLNHPLGLGWLALVSLIAFDHE